MGPRKQREEGSTPVALMKAGRPLAGGSGLSSSAKASVEHRRESSHRSAPSRYSSDPTWRTGPCTPGIAQANAELSLCMCTMTLPTPLAVHELHTASMDQRRTAKLRSVPQFASAVVRISCAESSMVGSRRSRASALALWRSCPIATAKAAASVLLPRSTRPEPRAAPEHINVPEVNMKSDMIHDRLIRTGLRPNARDTFSWPSLLASRRVAGGTGRNSTVHKLAHTRVEVGAVKDLGDCHRPACFVDLLQLCKQIIGYLHKAPEIVTVSKLLHIAGTKA